MRLTFDDNSYIEIKKSDEPGKVLIVISAKDHLNQLKKISNAVEVTTDEFKKIISDIL